MRAEAIATPVLELAAGGGRHGTVAGVTEAAAYLELEGSVLALTARRVPLMPNGIAVDVRPGREAWPRPGAAVALERGRIRSGGRALVAWSPDQPPAWEARVPPLRADQHAEGLARGRALLEALGVHGEPTATELARVVGASWLASSNSAGRRDGGLELLLRAAAERDADLAARAAALLVGRGEGLTPEGDDLLAGAAAAGAAAGGAARWPAADRGAWLAALRPPDLERRTTPLSATLLELAIRGQVMQPVHALLDVSPGGAEGWQAALRTLLRIGHSTGPAYAAQVAATLVLLSE
jgi:hypothetical protein